MRTVLGFLNIYLCRHVEEDLHDVHLFHTHCICRLPLNRPLLEVKSVLNICLDFGDEQIEALPSGA